MSALSRDISALFRIVLKRGQPSYISRRSLSSLIATSAEPRPNQPGRLKRLCIQENTHGMARIFVTPEWVCVQDFQTRFPNEVERAMEAAASQG